MFFFIIIVKHFFFYDLFILNSLVLYLITDHLDEYLWCDLTFDFKIKK